MECWSVGIILLCTTIYNKLSIIKDLVPFLDIILTWNSMIWATLNPGKKIPSNFFLKRNLQGKSKLFINFPKRISRVNIIPWWEDSVLEQKDRLNLSKRWRVLPQLRKKVLSVNTISTEISLDNLHIHPNQSISSCLSKPSKLWDIKRRW